jgi:hypothetical protein
MITRSSGAARVVMPSSAARRACRQQRHERRLVLERLRLVAHEALMKIEPR